MTLNELIEEKVKELMGNYKREFPQNPVIEEMERILRQALLNIAKETAEALRVEKDDILEYEEKKEIWCPKQNIVLKEYWSHHDVGKFCENCGEKVEVRTKAVVKNAYEAEEMLNTAIEAQESKRKEWFRG